MKIIAQALTVLIFISILSCSKKTETPAPQAEFTFSNGDCAGPCTVSFSNSSTNASVYVWDFGDGSSPSIDESPSHLYNAAGTYKAELTATGPGGSSTFSKEVVIKPAADAISFLVNGTTVNMQLVSGSRGLTSEPRTLTINGSSASGGNPKFKFFTKESFIGFEQGLHVGCYNFTYPDSYVEYTSSAGVVYSSANDANGVNVFFSQVSFVKDGPVLLTFSGSLKASNGSSVTITEGRVKGKFSN